MTRLIISSNPFLMRAARIINADMNVFSVRRKGDSSIAGNIYKGTVDSVNSSLGAAFINIGLERNGFLCTTKYCSENVNVYDSVDYKIGDNVLVQVSKPPISKKGPKLTRNITLPGNYIVLVRGSDVVGISKHIEDLEKRRSLRCFLEKYTKKDIGFIARTASQFADAESIESEIKYLINLNDEIEKKAYNLNAPCLIYEEPQMPIKFIREYCDDLTDEVIIDDEYVYDSIKTFFKHTNNKFYKKLHLYSSKKPVFSHFCLQEEMKNLLDNVVQLKNKGYIVIEKTEALFSIDVNSGSYNYQNSSEDAIFEINKEAAYEIFRQITLRDMGGIIVVDFIDMADERNKTALENILAELAKNDKKNSTVSSISSLGLVEISRRKNERDIFDEMFDRCETCFNSGMVKSIALICSDIYEKIKYSDDKMKLHAGSVIIENMKRKLSRRSDLEYQVIENCSLEKYYLEVLK